MFTQTLMNATALFLLFSFMCFSDTSAVALLVSAAALSNSQEQFMKITVADLPPDIWRYFLKQRVLDLRQE